MKDFSVSGGRGGARVLGVLAAATVLSAPIAAPAESAANGAAKAQIAPAAKQPTAAEQERWRRQMLLVPAPKKGCFTATYPEKTWREVRCNPPKPHPALLPHPGGISNVDTVGGGGLDFLPTMTGHLSSVEGSFDSGPGGNNSLGAFSLQLNTQPFSTPSACSSSPNNTSSLATGCRGWEQFIYWSDALQDTSAYFQYWLIDYGPAGTQCPMPTGGSSCDGIHVLANAWCPFQQTGGDPNPVMCAKGAAMEPAIGLWGTPTLNSLANMKLAGSVAGGDSMVVSMLGALHPGVTSIAMATGDNQFPELDGEWNEAEFNVFGPGSSAAVTFDSGSNLTVRTEVISGTGTLGCDLRSFTGESSNMTLVDSPLLSPSAIVFSETHPPSAGSVASCMDAVSIGDTHLTTFGGLLYDFQATGDFLLADTGREFVVETRQVSGAPSWPNAAVNRAVAVQSGRDRVALCLPNRLSIDGRPTVLRDGERRRLASGGGVVRKANVYTVFSAGGDSLRAEMDGIYINVSVGLGHWPSKPRGLLANVNGKANEVEARDGVILRTPLAFDTLYGHYTESWRVPAKESLLSVCGDRGVRSGIPKKTFSSDDLKPELAARNRTICTRAGVKKGPLLDACVIDVAMLGPKAAKTLAHRPAPVAVGDTH